MEEAFGMKSCKQANNPFFVRIFPYPHIFYTKCILTTLDTQDKHS